MNEPCVKSRRSSFAFLFPFLLLVALSSCILFYRLGDIDAGSWKRVENIRISWDRPWDEPLYAVRAKEMYLSNSLLAPLERGKIAWRSGKPPLGYWLIIVCFHLFGINPLTLRLPFAMAGMGCVLLLFHIGQQLGDQRLGLFSALGLLLMPGFLLYSRTAILEPVLTFLFLSILILSHHSRCCTPKKTVLCTITCGLGVGLALLTKQIVGLVIFPALLASEISLWRKHRDKGMTVARSLSLILAMTLSSGWWFLIMYHRHRFRFVYYYFVRNVFLRFTHEFIPHEIIGQGFYSILLQQSGAIAFTIGMAGVLLLLGLRLPRWRQSIFPLSRQGDSLLMSLLLFSGTYYLVFGLISHTFLPWYPFPLLPVLALGQGYVLWTSAEALKGQHKESRLRFFSLTPALLAASLAFLQGLYFAFYPSFFSSYYNSYFFGGN